MDAEKAQQICEQLLDAMGIAAVVEIDSKDPIFLSIQSKDSALLIGKRGENLRAIQILTNTILKHQGFVGYISLDVAGYKKERTEWIKAIAQEAAEKVRKNGGIKHLKPMNSFERRQVHTLLAGDSNIITESEGEGLARHVVIKPRNK